MKGWYKMKISPDDVYVVGAYAEYNDYANSKEKTKETIYGVILHYDCTSWNTLDGIRDLKVRVPGKKDLYLVDAFTSVWGSSGTDVYVGGLVGDFQLTPESVNIIQPKGENNGFGILLHYDGE